MRAEGPQASYSHGESGQPLLGETIGENLSRTVASFPAAYALVEHETGRRWTYGELDRDVDALAAGLIGLGIEKGDRVGIWSPNNAAWVLTQYATARIGAVLVNINPAYRVHELGYVLRQSGCKLVISAVAFRSSHYAAMLDEVRPDLPGLEAVVYIGSPEWEALTGTAGDGLVEALAERGSQLSFDDPINIQYTSGTTGFPKGATLSHHNILSNVFAQVKPSCYYHQVVDGSNDRGRQRWREKGPTVREPCTSWAGGQPTRQECDAPADGSPPTPITRATCDT
jgi:fatty-acyl-CoA synthase